MGFVFLTNFAVMLAFLGKAFRSAILATSGDEGDSIINRTFTPVLLNRSIFPESLLINGLIKFKVTTKSQLLIAFPKVRSA